MDKTISSRAYKVFLRELKIVRKNKGMTQIDLSFALGETQSFVSKCERGERRLDIVELREFCQALGTTLPKFVSRLENALSVDGEKVPRTRRKR